MGFFSIHQGSVDLVFFMESIASLPIFGVNPPYPCSPSTVLPPVIRQAYVFILIFQQLNIIYLFVICEFINVLK